MYKPFMPSNNTDRSFYAVKNNTLVYFTAYFTEQVLLDRSGEEFSSHSEGGSMFVCIKDGVLQTGKTTIFDSLAEAEACIAAHAGFVEVTDSEADVLMMTADVAPLPPMPEGMVPGTYAYTAWTMAQTGLMTGDEADAWKDEMKDSME